MEFETDSLSTEELSQSQSVFSPTSSTDSDSSQTSSSSKSQVRTNEYIIKQVELSRFTKIY